jgi:REP element-mobilizing transposase RayT
MNIYSKIRLMVKYAHDEWFKTETIRDNINLNAFVVMPNHIHGIIEIVNTHPFVGAIHESPLQRNINPELYRKHRRKMLIPKIIGWYKMNTAKQINQIRKTPGTKIWQRGYYDHIIRNEESLFHIWEYIKTNPMNWKKTSFTKTGNFENLGCCRK